MIIGFTERCGLTHQKREREMKIFILVLIQFLTIFSKEQCQDLKVHGTYEFEPQIRFNFYCDKANDMYYLTGYVDAENIQIDTAAFQHSSKMEVLCFDKNGDLLWEGRRDCENWYYISFVRFKTGVVYSSNIPSELKEAEVDFKNTLEEYTYVSQKAIATIGAADAQNIANKNYLFKTIELRQLNWKAQ